MSSCCTDKSKTKSGEECSKDTCNKTVMKTCKLKTADGELVDCECLCKCSCNGNCDNCDCNCKCSLETAKKIQTADGVKYRCECSCKC